MDSGFVLSVHPVYAWKTDCAADKSCELEYTGEDLCELKEGLKQKDVEKKF